MARRSSVLRKTSYAGDDSSVYVIRQDVSGGMNNRQAPSIIGENQGELFQNVDLTVPGERRIRAGLTLLEDLGANVITGLFGYDPQGGTGNLLVTEGANLKRWPGTGSFQTVSITMTTSLDTTMIKAYKTAVGDVCLISNGTDNVFEMTPAYAINDLGNTNTSPPKTKVLTTFRNRVWGLKGDLLYYSSASPSDYSAAFDRTTSYYRIPVGEERAIVGTRDMGIIVAGKEQVWALNPSTVPAATDKPEKLLDVGLASGDTFVQVGDDYIGLFYDGVRALKRTIQDKLQLGESLPISYPLKDEFEEINWTYITKACAVWFDNKYILSLPTVGATRNNKVWVYYPATQAWSVITGWNVSRLAKFKVGGEEFLYAGDSSGGGKVYRAFHGADDDGTAISYSEVGRSENLGYPLVKKVGGELKVVAAPTGDYNISVYGSFDEGDFNLLGYLNVSSNLITFPVSFPVLFLPDATSYQKFHLDQYGEWYTFTPKLSYASAITSEGDITIYETSLTANLVEYKSEEQA